MYSFLIGDEVFIINFHKIVKKQTFFFFTNRTNKHIPYSLHIYRASSSNHPSRMLHFLWHSLPSSVDPQGDSFRHFLFSELMPAKVNTDIKENIWFCVWMYNVMSFSVINVIFMDAVIYTYFTCICDSRWVLDFYLHMNSTNLISLIINFVLFLAWTVLPYINLWLYFLFH